MADTAGIKDSTSFFGQIGIYGGDGFYTILPTDTKGLQKGLKKLDETGFVDAQTRAVIVTQRFVAKGSGLMARTARSN